MKRIVISIFIISVLIAGIIGSPPAHGEPPVGVGLVLTDSAGNIKNSFQVGEEITVVVSLDNIPEQDEPRIDIPTSAGFSKEKFHLMLQFVYTAKDNTRELITAANLTGSADAPPPLSIPIIIEGKPVVLQAEEVEVLEAGWAIKKEPFNAQDFYKLIRSGRYTAQAVIPMRTYPLDAVQPAGIKKIAELDKKDFEGFITSNLEPFTIEEVLAIAGDYDGDGDVDRNDLNIMLAARNTAASGPEDPMDLDDDGMITGLDARKLVLMCTRPRCATE
jgi:hypothetical protein